MKTINNLIKRVRANSFARFMLVFGIIATIGSQIFIFFNYQGVIKDINIFVETEFNNEPITNVKEIPYPPGRGDYKVITTKDNPNILYPVLLTDYNNEDKISMCTTITKDKHSRLFIIKDNNTEYSFELRRVEEDRQGFMTIVFVTTIVWTLIMTFVSTIGKTSDNSNGAQQQTKPNA